MNKKLLSFSLLSMLFTQIPALCGSIETGKTGIGYNNFFRLSGSNDTLAVLSCDMSSKNFAVNLAAGTKSMQADTNSASWPLFRNIGDRVGDVAFGQNKIVECEYIDSVTDGSEQPRTNTVYLIDLDKKNDQVSSLQFSWNNALKNNKSVSLIANDAVYCNGAFYFACLDGQLVRFNLTDTSKSVLIPGTAGSFTINQFKGLTTSDTSKIDTTRRVIGVEAVKNLLIITTPNAMYTYSTGDSTWTTYNNLKLDQNATIKSFQACFARSYSSSYAFYSLVEAQMANGQTDTIVCKFSKKENSWRIMLDNSVEGITFGPKGYIYTIESNDIKIYHDTLGDSAVQYNPKPKNTYGQRIISRMLNDDYGISKPEYINDILFVPKTDTSGIFWIATSEGLFLSKNEIPEVSSESFTLFKRAPNISNGLKQVYARPGVLTASAPKGHTVFVYNLKKDAKVTIRVYDYNMDLVRTIIDNRLRKAGENGGPFGISTVENEDYWDGTKKTGMRVAPGVYYFKITSDNGDHAFGKIIVAK